MRIHILMPPHTVPVRGQQSYCAFTQHALELSLAMHRAGQEVYVYGAEGGAAECTEYVSVLPRDVFDAGWPEANLLERNMATDAPGCVIWNRLARKALAQWCAPGDIVCATFSPNHQVAIDGTAGLVVETGIGYNPGNCRADWRVYETNAWRQFHLGWSGLLQGNPKWFVVHDFVDVEQFDCAEERDDYLLFIGRLNWDKGVGIAVEAAHRLGLPLKLAGPGDPAPFLAGDHGPVQYLGVLDAAQRRVAMGKALAVLCPTQYVEPFCTVHIEAMLSGAPPVCSDHAVFPETVTNGVNGYTARAVVGNSETGVPRDIDEYVAAVEAAVSWPHAHRWAMRQEASERFGLQQYTAGHLRVFDIMRGASGV